MAFTQRAQLSHCACACRLKVMCTCILHLAHELSTQHGPACLFCFTPYKVGLHGIKCRLQVQNLSAVGRGCFVLPHGDELTVRDWTCHSPIVSSATGAVSFWDVVCESVSYLSWRLAQCPHIQHRAWGADILVYFYLHSRKHHIRCGWEVAATAFATDLFFLTILRQRLLFLSLILSMLSGPVVVSLKMLDPCVALAEKCFELYVGCPCGGELTPKGCPRKNRIRCIGGLFPFCGRKKDV